MYANPKLREHGAETLQQLSQQITDPNFRIFAEHGVLHLVTPRQSNLYAGLLHFIGQNDPTLGAPLRHFYAASCRWRPLDKRMLLQTWSHTLTLGQPLPTLPLWLTGKLAVPLELEQSYEQACHDLWIA